MEREPADSAWRCTAFSLAEGTSVSKEPCLSHLRFLLSSSHSLTFTFFFPSLFPLFPYLSLSFTQNYVYSFPDIWNLICHPFWSSISVPVEFRFRPHIPNASNTTNIF